MILKILKNFLIKFKLKEGNATEKFINFLIIILCVYIIILLISYIVKGILIYITVNDMSILYLNKKELIHINNLIIFCIGIVWGILISGIMLLSVLKNQKIEKTNYSKIILISFFFLMFCLFWLELVMFSLLRYYNEIENSEYLFVKDLTFLNNYILLYMLIINLKKTERNLICISLIIIILIINTIYDDSIYIYIQVIYTYIESYFSTIPISYMINEKVLEKTCVDIPFNEYFYKNMELVYNDSIRKLITCENLSNLTKNKVGQLGLYTICKESGIEKDVQNIFLLEHVDKETFYETRLNENKVKEYYECKFTFKSKK